MESEKAKKEKKKVAEEKCSCGSCADTHANTEDECSPNEMHSAPHPHHDKAENGCHVAISYIGILDDGEVFDRTEEGNPLMFTLGNGELLPDFEKAIVGMKVGDEKDIRLSASQAYGEKNPAMIQAMPKNLLEGKIAVEKGKRLMFSMPNGHRAYAEVVEILADSVKLDFNHPLAGKALKFHLKVLDID